jgi:hypothetical protein
MDTPASRQKADRITRRGFRLIYCLSSVVTAVDRVFRIQETGVRSLKAEFSSQELEDRSQNSEVRIIHPAKKTHLLLSTGFFPSGFHLPPTGFWLLAAGF